jgi:hypothetical protein
MDKPLACPSFCFWPIFLEHQVRLLPVDVQFLQEAILPLLSHSNGLQHQQTPSLLPVVFTMTQEKTAAQGSGFHISNIYALWLN